MNTGKLTPSDAMNPDFSGIPELAGKDIRFEPLPGGLTNQSYLVHGDFGRWVLRLNGQAPGVDRARESRVLEHVEDAGLGPTVVRNNPEAGYLIYDFVAGEFWPPDFARSAPGQTELGRWLRRLHDLPAEVPGVEPLKALRRYIEALPPRWAERMRERTEGLDSRLDAVRYGTEPRVLCHLDLVAGNIIGSGALVRVIDWEYAGLCPAPMDLALFLHHQKIPLGEATPLLRSYCGSAADAMSELLDPYLELAGLLERAWLLLQSDSGGDEEPPEPSAS